MPCDPYFDPTCFFSSNCNVKNSDKMLDICDQSKILNVPYFQNLRPANLYQKINTSNNLSRAYIEGFTNFFTDNGPGKSSISKG